MPDTDKHVSNTPQAPQPPSPAAPDPAVAKPVKVLSQLFNWIGQHDRMVLFSLLVATLAIWAFAALADRVSDQRDFHFDAWLLRAFRNPDDLAVPIGPHSLVEAVRDISALGGVTVLTMLTLGVAGFLGLRRMYGAMWLVVGSTLGGMIFVTVLKNLFDRPRPSLVPHLSLVFTSSFPSGHSMLSATVFLTLGALLTQFVHKRILKAYCLTIAVILTLMVGVSRVYLGVHYPSDVLAGWSAGLAWALICDLLAKFLQQRGTIEGDGGGSD
ncbi:MAG: superfamily protein [Planctomycetaceae bacterium]|nr:superfamily protein [Planctomycetaceae bacterium]